MNQSDISTVRSIVTDWMVDLEPLFDQIRNIAKVLLAAIVEVQDSFAAFCTLAAPKACDSPSQTISNPQMLPNSPNSRFRMPKVFEDGFLTKPMTRDQLLAILAILVSVFACFI
ncbi:hypothetical protein [Dubosiella newyorkensis]|uniref:hypothetical protein n=1 Tax=Dubosiella newyorkensis TaxID=1862672 RepID=UPI00272E4E73|nr:hypothetical protein [Dubosiella newyorkensis]